MTDNEALIENYEFGVIPDDIDDRDWIYESIHPPTRSASSIHHAVRQALGESIPKKLDLRPDMPPVRNQGGRGTCAAFVGATIKVWQEWNDYHFQGFMSPNYIYYHRMNKPGKGMTSRDVFTILKTHGICAENRFPYTSYEPGSIPDEALKEGPRHKISGYAYVKTVEGVKHALAMYGPCYMSIPVYNYGWRLWAPSDTNNKLKGYHAVTLVGYNKSGFIVRNSWGNGWVNKGDTIFPYEDFGMHMAIVSSVDVSGSTPFRKSKPKKKKKKKNSKNKCLCITLP